MPSERRRAAGRQILAAVLLGLPLYLPAALASADPGEPRAAEAPGDEYSARKSEGEGQGERSRPVTRPDSRRGHEKQAFQPSEKIPADVSSDLLTDI
jgi:hypothetical protein